ncbi:hypothetical protein WL71_24545 [Burkholderia ubonensis]|uniref:Uncharacterized protein n=1 Tax=Burkholderia ubonensis TaxID=101571 RepID=A0A119MEQ5_9BURK|nr:hypothetical protein WL71_24545 [Burkholderia ubonensis]KWD87683.1 hypothetical protein WL70_09370 [Burkholderia ubonensis]KWD89826.1 hypothetical protein WL72_32795 [Burkholderia ubonensis]KWD96443.1 hypothetical protein WL73_23110 [Burkholderia ubonensis]
MRYSTVPLRPWHAPLNPRRGGSQWQIHNPTQKDGIVSATTPDQTTHTRAGVPPAPPEAHRLAGIRQSHSRLRATATHWFGCAPDTPIRVLHRWSRPDDDARAVRLETVIDGNAKRITLFRQPSGAWSPMPL